MTNNCPFFIELIAGSKKLRAENEEINTLISTVQVTLKSKRGLSSVPRGRGHFLPFPFLGLHDGIYKLIHLSWAITIHCKTNLAKRIVYYFKNLMLCSDNWKQMIILTQF